MSSYESALRDFEKTTATCNGITRDVYRIGTGPGVIVIHEIPGITPQVADFGRRVAAAGCTAVLPVLFGEPGKPLGVGYALQILVSGCVAKDFATFATDTTSPATVWLRELAAQVHEECGGPGVGAVGMCFTGGFALAMMVDDRMLAPVLSQPSLPFPFSKRHRADLGISTADLARVKQRAENGQCLLGLRFSADKSSPSQRFDTLQRELGDAFIAVEIDSAPGNPYGIKRSAHSVLTNDLVDEPGHPTREALDQVLTFFRERLGV